MDDPRVLPGAPAPTDEERRRAVCAAMASAPGLLRFAARYTRSLHDAEDAYQRAMEIALTQAPVTDPRRFMAWLHTVLKHEALAVARGRRREGPGAEDDVATTHAGAVADAARPDVLAEWRERYRAVQDALGGLTESQRVCLMLQSAGASYARIGELTGFSARKIERSVLEGRRNLHQWEVGLASGAVCARLLPGLERLAAGEASSTERRTVKRHLRHCHPCRALYRTRRDAREWMAALVPGALLAGDGLAAAPDPGPYMPHWDRLAGNLTVRMGQLVQVAMELPGTALARAGAGAAAITLAGVATVPYAVDAVRAPEPPPLVRPVEATALLQEAADAAAPAPRARPPAKAAPAPRRAPSARLEAPGARAPRAPKTPPTARPRTLAPDPAPAVPAPAPAVPRAPAPSASFTPTPAPAPPAPPAPSAVMAEFGP